MKTPKNKPQDQNLFQENRQLLVGPRLIIQLLGLLIASLSITSCSQTDLKGKYVCRTCLIAAMDFKDGKACIIAGGIADGADAGCFKYRKQGKSYFIIDPRKGDVRLDKVDENTLKGFGVFEGTYIKK